MKGAAGDTMNLKKLTTLQKALLGVAGVGLIVLLYDQFGGPARADAAGAADVPAPSSSDASAPAPVPSAAAPVRAAPLSLGARLRATATDASAPLNDPFARSLAPASGVRSSEDSVAEFAAKYRMTGVMTSGNSRAAIINGVLVKRGQSIDGMRLIEVTPASATFESASGGRVVLRMGGDTPDSPAPARRRG